jgi:hypothetical protein
MPLEFLSVWIDGTVHYGDRDDRRDRVVIAVTVGFFDSDRRRFAALALDDGDWDIQLLESER